MNVALPVLPQDRDSREILICFSHLRWHFVFQRPHHLLTRAARTYEVFYWEEPVFEDIDRPCLDRSTIEEGITILVPHLPHMNEQDASAAQSGLLESFIAASRRPPSVLWYYTPMALQFSPHISADVVVYDNMDELSAFNGAPPQVVAMENQMFSLSDIVVTGGQSLYEAKMHRHANIHAYPSSIDAAHFHKARRTVQDPADQAGIPHPRIGFFGVVDERMDIELLDQVAAQRPDWQFVMIGPVVKIDPASLPRRSNIHWLGAKPYRELPYYLAHWDLGFMPFALNDATRFISPTKTPEYLAAGLPVLSTRIRDVVQPYGEKGLVDIIDCADSFCAQGDRLLQRPKQTWLSEVDDFLALNSWDKTWAAMQERICKARPRRGAEARLQVSNI